MTAGVLLFAAALGAFSVEGGPSPCAALDRDSSFLPSYPPCFEVTLTADTSGAPPLTHLWTLPTGTILTGNPLVLDTELLPTGFNTIDLTVSNHAGTASLPVTLVVEDLAFTAPPSFTLTTETTVAALANTTGATQWRWSWGDGTVSPWTSGCPGYAPSHTYPAPGTYQVIVEARSCRAGPITATGTLDVGGAPPVDLIEDFRVLCPTSPFCTFAVGDVLSFATVLNHPPDSYIYDWDGDGFDDEASAAAVLEHVYSEPGYYTPRLTVLAGQAVDRQFHPAPIEILAASSLLFDHDFEAGTLAGWTVP